MNEILSNLMDRLTSLGFSVQDVACLGILALLGVAAAVAMGGTSMSGGSGSILKTITGIITIGIINNCLSLLRVDSYWQPVVMGVIIFAAVTFDKLKVSTK